MNRLPNLPVGKSSFERIREDDDVYVDETRHLFEMVDRGQYDSLSRPRRFGESLTVSSLIDLDTVTRNISKWKWERE